MTSAFGLREREAHALFVRRQNSTAKLEKGRRTWPVDGGDGALIGRARSYNS